MKYREQIDAIASIPNMKYRRIARIIAWLYGGTEESWRKILASMSHKKKMPEDVRKLVEALGKTKRLT
jgi:DNA-directed RNA polymerase subunit F